MTPYATAQQAYRDSAILTASPERLVVMLYDGAHRFLHQAAVAMRANDLSRTNERLQRAEAIIAELRSTLNFDAGEIANQLEAIYAFCQRHLLEARLKRDPERIDKVMELLSTLREGWEGICAKG